MIDIVSSGEIYEGKVVRIVVGYRGDDTVMFELANPQKNGPDNKPDSIKTNMRLEIIDNTSFIEILKSRGFPVPSEAYGNEMFNQLVQSAIANKTCNVKVTVCGGNVVTSITSN